MSSLISCTSGGGGAVCFLGIISRASLFIYLGSLGFEIPKNSIILAGLSGNHFLNQITEQVGDKLDGRNCAPVGHAHWA